MIRVLYGPIRFFLTLFRIPDFYGAISSGFPNSVLHDFCHITIPLELLWFLKSILLKHAQIPTRREPLSPAVSNLSLNKARKGS